MLYLYALHIKAYHFVVKAYRGVPFFSESMTVLVNTLTPAALAIARPITVLAH